MAIDFLVAGVLLCSASVNILALGAFWITPSLRTTANRFVVNLLVVNLVCCIILAPSLLLNSLNSFVTPMDETAGIALLPPSAVPPSVAARVDCVPAARNCSALNMTTAFVAPVATDEIQTAFIDDKYTFMEIRSWGLDFAAALGALSVLLVVTDTWCAVTDPLRYHSRLSDPKSWCYIAGVWVIGVAFGIASALRDDPSEIVEDDDDFYNTLFSYTYFLVIILTPFVLICGMYWRIFREARQSGQRMRQNGSSPLLQSALNLAGVTGVTNGHNTVLRIDGEPKERELRPLLVRASPPLQRPPATHHPRRKLSVSLDTKPTPIVDADRNQNSILLTLTTAGSTEQIRRNQSAKHLAFESSTMDGPRVTSPMTTAPLVRHATSTPDLHKAERVDLGPSLVLPLPSVHIAHNKPLGYMNSIRHRLSNASSLFKYREESRAARISILVVVMFLVSYLPYGVLVLLQGHEDLMEAADQSLLAIFAVILANLSSPFIFAYRNKRVRKSILRLLGADRKLNDSLHKMQHSGSMKATPKKATFVDRPTVRSAPASTNPNAGKFLTPQTAAISINGSYIVDIDRFSPPPSADDGATVSDVEGETRSILKRVCRKWGCACAADACSVSNSGSVAETTEV